MSARREHRRRHIRMVQHIWDYKRWMRCQPPRWQLIQWLHWLASEPTL